MTHRAAPAAATEDQVIFAVLVVTLFFLAFMASLPIWFSGFVRALGS